MSFKSKTGLYDTFRFKDSDTIAATLAKALIWSVVALIFMILAVIALKRIFAYFISGSQKTTTTIS